MVTLVDPHGRPIRAQQLKQQQTAQVASLHNEFDTHPVRGLTPARLAAILESAETGDLIAQCDLFEDIEEKDGHILAELGKRKRAVLGVEWTIEPPRNATPEEEKLAVYAEEVIRDMADLDDVMLDLLDAISKGYSLCEIEWQLDGREWLPAKIQHRPPRWFMLDRATRTELRLRDMSMDGQPLQPFGWLTHVHKAKSGYITRAGLGRCLVWPFLFKNYSVRDLAEFLEIYGLPPRIGTYPNGATDEEKRTLLRAVVNIGHAAAGIIPEGMMMEFKAAAGGGEGPFMAMIDWCERIESKAIVGQTLSAEAKATGMGSGVADLQGDVRWDLTVSDCRQLDSTLTRDLVYPILALNKGLPSLRRCPRFRHETELEEDLNARAERDTKIFSLGYEPSEDYIVETYGDGWAKKAAPAEPPPAAGAQLGQPTQPAPADPAQLRAVLAALKGDQPSDVTDPLVDQLGQAAAPVLAGWLDTLRGLATQADSLEALRDRLLAAYGDLPTADLAAVMQLGFVVADLTGRFDVIAEVDALRGAESR